MEETNQMLEQPKKQKLTPKQMKSAARKRKRNNFSTAMAVFIVFLAFYLVISLASGGLLLYSFYNTERNDEVYSLNVVYDEHILYTLDSEDANNDYGLYIPFAYLAEIGSFGLSGEGDEVTLFIIGTENRIKCSKNSSLVVINNNPIRISSPILYENDEYLIPVSLLENYINGIDVTYDEEEMICSVSSGLSKSDVSLKMLLPEAMEMAYFPESYKYYDFEQSQGSEEPDIIP